MHGNNEPRHLESAIKGYQVHDVFYTIQGEGPFAGLAAVFVRLTGCNLRCHWCDTVWDDTNDKYYSPAEICERIKQQSPTCKLVVLTGGEPCRWNLDPLLVSLNRDGYKVQVETAGTIWLDALTYTNVTIVCSPKVAKVHPKFKEYCNHWKYVVRAGDSDPNDGLPVEGTQRPRSYQYAGKENPWLGGSMCRPPRDRKVEVYLQPCDEQDPIKNKANMDHMVQVAMKYGYRAGLQLHKIFNLP